MFVWGVGVFCKKLSTYIICLALFQSLTNGSGFYKLQHKEAISDGRRLVLYKKKSQEFLEDFTGKQQRRFTIHIVASALYSENSFVIWWDKQCQARPLVL